MAEDPHAMADSAHTMLTHPRSDRRSTFSLFVFQRCRMLPRTSTCYKAHVRMTLPLLILCLSAASAAAQSPPAKTERRSDRHR